MESEARKRFARRLRMLRSARGWSQEVLAHLSGLNRSYIGSVERLEHNIGLDNMEKIATAFDLTVEDLISGRDPEANAGGHNGRRHPLSAASTNNTGISLDRKTFLRLLAQTKRGEASALLTYLEKQGVHLKDE